MANEISVSVSAQASKGGAVALFPASTATIYAKADTGAVNLLVQAIEL